MHYKCEKCKENYYIDKNQGNINGDGIICKDCEEEYILNTDNNTCLKRNSNKELEQFNTLFLWKDRTPFWKKGSCPLIYDNFFKQKRAQN